MSLLKKNILRGLTLVGYLILICGAFAILGQLYVYLNTGADRSKILHVPTEMNAPHQPIISWDTSQVKGRAIDPTTLASIERDYFQAWHVRAISLQVNDSAIIKDYFTKHARKKYRELIAFNTANNIHVTSTTLSHAPKIHLFSEDGQLVTLTDQKVTEYIQVYKNKVLQSTQTQIARYDIMMLLEDGHWRIRQMVLTETENLPELKTVDASLFANWDGVNYYPQETPWNTFGEKFDNEVIRDDFALIRSSGLNSVRIFLNYEDLGKENVKPERLKKIKQLLDLAQEVNLKVLITLFDFYGNYDIRDWTFTQKHAVEIVAQLKDHPAIEGWDIKNEPDLDFKSRGETQVTEWLAFMARCIKQIDPDHPVTVGWSSINEAHRLSSVLDLLSFHYYDDIDQLENSYKSLQARYPERTILLSEYGLSSHAGWWQFFKNGDEDQSEYHQQVSGIIKALEIPSVSWTLYDFETIPEKVLGTSTYRQNLQKKYGFIDINGVKKPSYKYISKR